MDTCRSCGAEVVFVPSAKTGKAMILDAKPEKRVVITDVVGMWVDLKRDPTFPLDRAEATVIDVYTDHHVTCPDAAAWKGKRR